MKKTFRFLSMAALLVVGATMTGCSNDDNINNPQQPANKDNVVTLTATVGFEANAGNRAINTSTGVKTFEAGNQIAVIYKNTSNETVKAVSTVFTPTGDNTKATFTVTLTNPVSNSAIRYIYPATMAKTPATTATITDDATIDYSGLFGSQDGTLATIGTKYDLAKFDGNLSGTSLPASVSLTNPLAICKFKLKDESSNDITSTINRLTLSHGTYTYRVSSSGLSEIYVAMIPATAKMAFTAVTGSKTYFKMAQAPHDGEDNEKMLSPNMLFTNISVSMVELAVGKVICSDGNVYASKSEAVGASKTPVAVIVYLGSNTDNETFKNGLAIALADESGEMNWSTAVGICGAKTAITGTKWSLPSRGQWTQMFIANGGDDEKWNGLNTTITTAGGTTLQDGGTYWTSEEEDYSDAYMAILYEGGSAQISSRYKDATYRVRACLAF